MGRLEGEKYLDMCPVGIKSLKEFLPEIIFGDQIEYLIKKLILFFGVLRLFKFK
tara:strand:- start:104 stop:265 length:162 start_codon:yes stop_codon:yes gene_type:complete